MQSAHFQMVEMDKILTIETSNLFVGLLENDVIPLPDLVNALQSLSRRFWIEQQANFYTVLPVLRQYAIARAV